MVYLLKVYCYLTTDHFFKPNRLLIIIPPITFERILFICQFFNSSKTIGNKISCLFLIIYYRAVPIVINIPKHFQMVTAGGADKY